LKRGIIIAALLACGVAPRASAGEVLDRVRNDRIVRCASDKDVDAVLRLCRAVARRVLGLDGQATIADGPPALDTDIAVVDGNDTPDRFVAGPVLFQAPLAVLVPAASRVRAPRDLGGETVCLMIGSAAQDALEQFARGLRPEVVHFGFEEDVEMADAYAVGRCGAMVGETAWLTRLRGPLGVNGLRSRLLDEPLGVSPMFVATDRADPEWTAIVAKVAREQAEAAAR
jgi:hypothetical protein